MKIIVFSDSHGYLENMKTAVNNFNDLDILIHLGDFLKDSVKIASLFDSLKVYGVSGNNDFTDELRKLTLDISGNKIFLAHGDQYDIYYNTDKLYYAGKECGANIMLFGHTHKPFLEQTEDCLILNPGSISYPRGGNICTFAIIDINNDINIKFYGIFKNKIEEIFIKR